MKTCPTCQITYPNNFAVCPQDGTALHDLGSWTDGSVIRGKYRILGKVGQGGMGAVYKALHLAFNELRALKVIAPELLHDELFAKRFKHEAVITRKLQHPNAVRVDDIDEAEDGRPFIVMEFIQGKSLKKVIQEEGPLPIPRVCSIIKQTASALDGAHRLGMVHRDIKPDNIALIESPEGELVKVLDFGIAKLKEARLGETSSVTLTGTGVVIGTPQYMSPEQAMGKRGEELDGRSDLYSLGVVMYEMLTADLPFKADTTMGMLLAHIQQPPRPIRTLRPELQIPAPIASLTMRLLEKDPAQRPASAKALIEEVEAVEKGSAPLPGTRVMEPTTVVSPEEIPGAPEAVRSAPAKGSAAVLSSVVPAAPPPIQPALVTPRTPVPAIIPTSELGTPSRWGIWVGIVILLVGLGGGGWYISSIRKTPVITTPSQGVGESQQTPSQPPLHEQNPPVSESPQRRAPVHAENQREPTRTSFENPPSGVNIAPTGPKALTKEDVLQLLTAFVPPWRIAAVVRDKGVSFALTRAAEDQIRQAGGNDELLKAIREVAPKPTAENPTGGVNIAPAGPTVLGVEAVNPTKIKAAITEGDFWFSKYQYDDAIKAYEEGLKLDPSNAELLQKLARAKKAKATEEKVLQ